jgi:hypothetical protein
MRYPPLPMRFPSHPEQLNILFAGTVFRVFIYFIFAGTVFGMGFL